MSEFRHILSWCTTMFHQQHAHAMLISCSSATSQAPVGPRHHVQPSPIPSSSHGSRNASMTCATVPLAIVPCQRRVRHRYCPHKKTRAIRPIPEIISPGGAVVCGACPDGFVLEIDPSRWSRIWGARPRRMLAVVEGWYPGA